MIFLDTSALVKRYIDEPGSSRVEKMFTSGEALAVSLLAYAETLAALRRRERAGDISLSDMKSAAMRFEADWKKLAVIPLGDHLKPVIKRVINRRRLRGADAVHLASALFLMQSLETGVAFAASDAELLAAAEKEGVSIYDPAAR
ncbi:MAG: type II toxin-antitoxin system VapC family toxin [Nitrospinae bacterium]|nr:type II toxin-antitoxin system VapC family toxin [Nitrospinota bacterium]